MTIKAENIGATYVDSITIEIVLFSGDVILIRVHDRDVIDELQSDEWFFDSQENVDWLLEVGHIIER